MRGIIFLVGIGYFLSGIFLFGQSVFAEPQFGGVVEEVIMCTCGDNAGGKYIKVGDPHGGEYIEKPGTTLVEDCGNPTVRQWVLGMHEEDTEDCQIRIYNVCVTVASGEVIDHYGSSQAGGCASGLGGAASGEGQTAVTAPNGTTADGTGTSAMTAPNGEVADGSSSSEMTAPNGNTADMNDEDSPRGEGTGDGTGEVSTPITAASTTTTSIIPVISTSTSSTTSSDSFEEDSINYGVTGDRDSASDTSSNTEAGNVSNEQQDSEPKEGSTENSITTDISDRQIDIDREINNLNNSAVMTSLIGGLLSGVIDDKLLVVILIFFGIGGSGYFVYQAGQKVIKSIVKRK